MGRLKVDSCSCRQKSESRRFLTANSNRTWMPVFAGMTDFHFARGERFQPSPERH